MGPILKVGHLTVWNCARNVDCRPKLGVNLSMKVARTGSGAISAARPMPLSDSVSRQMSRMPRKDTVPELRLRHMLYRLGYRYRVHPNLPGRPDIAFSRVRLAVFMDGCFWHACSEHGAIPKNNREWWRQKLARNVARDAEKDDTLRSLGWTVIRVWEHEDISVAAERVAGVYQQLSRTGCAPLSVKPAKV